MAVARSRYRTSAPPAHVSGLSNDTYDYVPRQTSYDEESFDAESSSDALTSAHRRRKAPRGSKLSLGKRDARGAARRGSKLKGSSAAAAVGSTDPVSKAMSSVQRIQINELKNEIELLALELDEIKKENKVLKRTVVIHEKSLGKYEDKDGDLSQLMDRHNQEIHALRELMKRSKDDNRKLTKALRDTQEELESTRRQLKKLQALADSDNLVERDDLSKKLKAATEDLDRKSERISELEKHIELLVKNHNRELNVETKRLRDVKAELEELRSKHDRVQPHSKVRETMHAITEDGHGGNPEKQHQPHLAGSASALLSPTLVETHLNRSLTKGRTPRLAAGSTDAGSDQHTLQLESARSAEHAASINTAPAIYGRVHGGGSVDLPEDVKSAATVNDRVRQTEKRSEDHNDRAVALSIMADKSSSTQQHKHQRTHDESEEAGGLRSMRHSVSDRGVFQLTESLSDAGRSKESNKQESDGGDVISFSPPPWNKRSETRQPNTGSTFNRGQAADVSRRKGSDSPVQQEPNPAEPFSGRRGDERLRSQAPAAPSEAAAAEERRKKELLLQKMKEIDRGRGLDDTAALLRQLPADAKPSSAAARGDDLPLAGGAAVPAQETAVASLKPASERRDKLLKLLRIDPSNATVTDAADAAASGYAGAYQPSLLARDQPTSGGFPAPAPAAAPKKSNLIAELFGDDGKRAQAPNAAATVDDDGDLFAGAAGKKQAPGRVGRHPVVARDADDSLSGAPAAARGGGALLPLRAAADSGSLRGRPGAPRSFLDHPRDDDDIEEVML